jgi:chromosome segregation ATPase
MEELTIKEAADYYGKSESWIRKKILSGELKAEKRPFKYGKRWTTTEKNLDDLAKKLKEQAVEETQTVNIREVNRPISAEEMKDQFKQLISAENEKVGQEVINTVVKELKQANEPILDEFKVISKQLKDKDEKNQKLHSEIKDLISQKNDKEKLIQKLKNQLQDKDQLVENLKKENKQLKIKLKQEREKGIISKIQKVFK